VYGVAFLMLPLVLRVIGEILIGLLVAGIALGIAIPILMKSGVIAESGISGFLVIAGTLVLAICGMLVRPGSALKRYGKR
jgi:high-affinity Fe2+/Pb2+ permease